MCKGIKLGISIAAALMFAGNAGAAPIIKKTPSVGGVWQGTLTFSDGRIDPIAGTLDEAGNGYFVDAHYNIYSTSAAATIDDANVVTLTFTRYGVSALNDGGGQISGTALLQGPLVEHSTLSGSFNEVDGGGTFSLSYTTAIYAIPAAYTALAGSYVYSAKSPTGAPAATTLNFDSSGAITGGDAQGCVISGSTSIPAFRYNAYELTLSWDCAGAVYPFNGYATLVPSVTIPNTQYSTPQSLALEYNDDTHALAAAAIQPQTPPQP